MQSITDPALIELLQKRFQEEWQARNGVQGVINNDNHDRETLLASMRQLMPALEAPDDIVNRVVFFVCSLNQTLIGLLAESNETSHLLICVPELRSI
jgi:hypothetical protein